MAPGIAAWLSARLLKEFCLRPYVQASLELMQPETGLANLLVAASRNPGEKKQYDLLRSDEPEPMDEIAKRSGLNSLQVLATLFDLAMRGVARRLPGKLFSKVLL